MRRRGAEFLLSGCGRLGAGYAGCGGGETGSGGAGGAGGAGPNGSSSGKASSSSKASGITSSSSGNVTGALAESCMSDADCGGLTCLKPTDSVPALGGGGPAAGYCSKTCANDTDCPGGAAGASICATDGMGNNGICLPGCTFGPPLRFLDDPLDPSKCHGRDDVRCQSLNMASIPAACIPTCGKDNQCPAPRVCDPRIAICVDTANVGKPTGAKCN